ncbi:MAG: ribonuclease HII [Propionibacterium sp.]|nr:MAG: ribonuclease HII [Propionibacterium sp.]
MGVTEPYRYEQELVAAGLGPVAGADEAGRGACAGPLVAAAVVLDSDNPIDGLNDSKKLSRSRREALFARIQQQATAVSVAYVSPQECDQLGMHQADLQGLRRAIAKLEVDLGFALTDGFEVPGLGVPSLSLWKGDQAVACVSAASIVAKVTRDSLMVELDQQYPGYGLAKHMGYCTKEHQEALLRLGPSPIHRWCFDPVARAAKVEPR